MKHEIEAIIVSECADREDEFISIIPLNSSGAEIPIPFRRLPFPIRIRFAMSINKSQVLTLTVAGVHLDEPCF